MINRIINRGWPHPTQAACPSFPPSFSSRPSLGLSFPHSLGACLGGPPLPSRSPAPAAWCGQPLGWGHGLDGVMVFSTHGGGGGSGSGLPLGPPPGRIAAPPFSHL